MRASRPARIIWPMLPILLIAAAGTLIPALGLWLSDQGPRIAA